MNLLDIVHASIYIKSFKESSDYQTALSMQLLKKGKWKIKEWKIKRPLHQRCLEYIFEEVSVIFRYNIHVYNQDTCRL